MKFSKEIFAKAGIVSVGIFTVIIIILISVSIVKNTSVTTGDCIGGIIGMILVGWGLWGLIYLGGE